MFSSANANKRRRRWWVAGLLLLLLIVPAAFVTSTKWAPGFYGDIVEQRVSAATGLEVQIEAVDIGLSPTVLSAGALRLTDPAQTDAGPLLKVDHVQLEIELLSWMSGGKSPWSVELEGSAADGLPLELTAAGRVDEGEWVVEELQARLGASRLSGHGQLDPGRQRLDFSFNSPHLVVDEWQALMPVERADTGAQTDAPGWPLRGWQLKLDGTVELVEYQDFRIEQVSVSVSSTPDRPEQLELSISSHYPKWLEGADQFATLAVQSTVQSQQRGWLLKPLELALDELEFSGRLLLDGQASPPGVELRLQGDTLDINRLRTSARLSEEQVSENDDQPWALPSQPLDWGWLSAVEGRLELDLRALHVNHTVFRNNRLRATLDNGTLAVSELSAELREGRVYGEALISRRPNEGAGVAMETELLVDRLQPADLGIEDEGLIDGGETNLLLDLSTSGSSIRDFISELSGEFATEVQSATVRNQWLDLVGSDLLMQLTSAFIPGAQDKDYSTLECAAAYFEVNEGVVQSIDQIILETPVTVVRGSARVNLVEGDLRVDFKPSARTGLGVGLGKLASVVRVAGTISDPKIEASPGGIVKTGVTLGAAFASGGMSLLAQGLFDRTVNAGGTACGQLLEDEATG